MGLFSKLFGKNEKEDATKRREGHPDVVNVHKDDVLMDWAIQKSGLTLHYFEKCLKVPKPTQQYFSIKVKIEDDGKIEHIWLTQPTFDDEGNLFGVVGNKPMYVQNVSMNQRIGIDRDLISDWMIIEDGRLIGGYTIRAVRDKLDNAAQQEFDKGLGGMIVDSGEDYFLPSDSTPEGAIMKLEEAYDSDDIEGAMACKDFKAEAKIMLSKMRKGNVNDDIIEKTAEVLYLSFIKSLQENGIPKFKEIKRAFPKREMVDENHWIITEVCYYPDGSQSVQRLNTFRSPDGWKVLHPES